MNDGSHYHVYDSIKKHVHGMKVGRGGQRVSAPAAPHGFCPDSYSGDLLLHPAITDGAYSAHMYDGDGSGISETPLRKTPAPPYQNMS